MSLEAMLRSTWIDSVETFRANVRTIRLAGVPPVDEDRATAARYAAHRLAGSLGMLGLDRGSELANHLEALMRDPAGPDQAHVRRLADAIGKAIEDHDARMTGSPGADAGGPD
jgi:HPt (histidine-containing phosphotransfer) domain-containing protein